MSAPDRAQDQFTKNLERLFAQLPIIPSDEIESIHSFGLAEDNKTLIVMLDLVGGGTFMMQAEPGKPLAVGLV